MWRERISSSAIASVGYDAASRTLEVEFRSGAVYQYIGVPPSEYRRFMAAESRGAYLNTRLKPRYGYVRIQG
ncbi:KTSC domain-containing protein [Actinobacteria bacterium YIM 96077]|uniref:KTSC domain-containing protein n=1 Tax=Phytoactinopolyspora halophila TaxID=1981511 RepID=A0A329QDD0_9ACTN|nr:KTSC domain-containing protein [Actinobacteria bacterium YIM 96077]RAW10294.1 KTSC domain-containing protein [Phytoactinopolyspora halophila]